jgi:ATP-dependent 26S proteasome regulatory subunit
MAKALASNAEAQFFHVSASDLAKKYVGESEDILKQINEYEKIKKAKQSLGTGVQRMYT